MCDFGAVLLKHAQAYFHEHCLVRVACWFGGFFWWNGPKLFWPRLWARIFGRKLVLKSASCALATPPPSPVDGLLISAINIDALATGSLHQKGPLGVTSISQRGPLRRYLLLPGRSTARGGHSLGTAQATPGQPKFCKGRNAGNEHQALKAQASHKEVGVAPIAEPAIL